MFISASQMPSRLSEIDYEMEIFVSLYINNDSFMKKKKIDRKNINVDYKLF